MQPNACGKSQAAARPRSRRSSKLARIGICPYRQCFVYQAQGSQWPRVIVPITRSRVLDRTLVYTAVTRAQRQVINPLASAGRRSKTLYSLTSNALTESFPDKGGQDRGLGDVPIADASEVESCPDREKMLPRLRPREYSARAISRPPIRFDAKREVPPCSLPEQRRISVLPQFSTMFSHSRVRRCWIPGP